MSTINYKSYKQPSRGFELLIQVPATVSDFDNLVGDGSCLGYAVAEGVYRSILPKVWKLFMERAPEAFGVEVAKTGEKVSKRNPEAGPTDVFETIETYLPKVKQAAEAASRTAELRQFVQSLVTEVGFNLEKVGRTKKPDKVFYNKAQELAEKVARGESTWDRVQANCTAKGATSTIVFAEDGSVDLDSLAQVVMEALTADTGLA